MAGSVRSIIDLGNRGWLVEIECHLSNNLPTIVIVGSASKAVDEAKERVRAAFLNSSLALPRKRITLNLAPADLHKAESSFDLAMAVAILLASKQIPAAGLEQTAVIGELGLNGDVRPVRGVIGKLLTARNLAVTNFVIPQSNLLQAQLVPNIRLLPVDSLKQVYDYLTTGTGLVPINTGDGLWNAASAPAEQVLQLGDIIGQAHAKRAVQIAAAGGHNLFLSGPPGTGKSMLAKTLPGLLPPLTHDETLEVTYLHSLATRDYDQLVYQRPLRSPHHSASLVSLVGGGLTLRPGEISLAHHGVLFLDEMPEFARASLEALRQPLEDKTITVARARDSVLYPANFLLVGTANPCPCGYYGSSKPCTCLPHQIAGYRQRISGPIMDRIDLHTTVSDIDHRNLLATPTNAHEQDTAYACILRARKTEANRYDTASRLNADMTNQQVKQYAQLIGATKDMLDSAAERLGLSARSYLKTVKVARTIADLADSRSIEVPHLAEALQFRRTEEALVA